MWNIKVYETQKHQWYDIVWIYDLLLQSCVHHKISKKKIMFITKFIYFLYMIFLCNEVGEHHNLKLKDKAYFYHFSLKVYY
jgi:hypothetical protein